MDIYKDIETRTNGEIYMGVVGPVRTGKSTFIKRFMEMLVLPLISDENSRLRAKDELPQSATGRTVMTTEPKFIPKEAVEIELGNSVKLKLRMIDCVGYMVESAKGHMEGDKERLVNTPWFDYQIPFTKAAEIGTRKVIFDHSTVGILVTCDGTITDIPREAYVEAERRTVEELKQINKPFVMILNSTKPSSAETLSLAKQLAEEYEVNVLPVNCDSLKKSDVNNIFEMLLLDFPVSTIEFDIPKWVEAMDEGSEIKTYLIKLAKDIFLNISHMRDIKNIPLEADEYIEKIDMSGLNLATGQVCIKLKLFDKYYYEMLSALLGTKICNEYDFIHEVRELSETKKECKKVSQALLQAHKTGYGSVAPADGEIHLSEPELIKSGNKYGVKIKAEAPSIHLIRANITTEIAPIIGDENQARDLIKYINSDGLDSDGIWGVNIFGKTVKQLVEDGLVAKVNKINQESQQKLQDTMEKIVNDSNGGMVCIII